MGKEAIAKDYEPKVGSQLQISVRDRENDSIIQKAKLEVVEGKDGKLTTQLLSHQRAEGQEPPPEGFAAMAQSAAEGKASKAKGGSPELEIAKFAWQIIKENRPVADAQGASTSVLYRNTDPLDYERAVSFQSSTFEYRITDSVFKDLVLVSADMRLEGMHRAVPSRGDIPNGFYLPSVSFRVLSMNVGWSFKLEASAQVAPVANVGTADNVQPRLKIYANLNASWLFQASPMTVSFEADGKRGGVLGYFSAGSKRI